MSVAVRRISALGLTTAMLFAGAASLPTGNTSLVVSAAAPQDAQAFLRIRIPTSCDSFWGQFMRNCPKKWA